MASRTIESISKCAVPAIFFTLMLASNCAAAEKLAVIDHAPALKLGFSDVFDKKFYEKKSFGLVVLGTTVVVGGAVSYATAGAGAPTALTGVSTVASWVGGGGAGSYMAGLSTIGSVFGGNAMLGAAMLNGISMATIGGGAGFSTLTATQKALAITSVSASMLDGVAVVAGPETKTLNYQVALSIPRGIGSKDLRKQAEKLRKLGKDERELGEKIDELYEDQRKAQKEGMSLNKEKAKEKLNKAEAKLRETKNERAQLEKLVASRASDAIKKNEPPEDIVLLSVLAKNLGKSDVFEKLMAKMVTDNAKDAGYVYYLQAVAQIQRRKIDSAKDLLEKSSMHDPYAIEPSILRVNILGHQGFNANKNEVLDIVARAEKNFDSEKYVTPFSMVSLYYRVGTLALINKDYGLAETQFKNALDARSVWEKYGLNKKFESMLQTGLANAFFGQGRSDEAQAIIDKILKKAKDGRAREVICAQYMGRCV